MVLLPLDLYANALFVDNEFWGSQTITVSVSVDLPSRVA